MSRMEAAESIYTLIYDTFETKGFGVGSLLVSQNQKNDIQFKLMKSIAMLKDQSQDISTACDQVLADANIAHTMGYLTNETFKNIEDILGEL